MRQSFSSARPETGPPAARTPVAPAPVAQTSVAQTSVALHAVTRVYRSTAGPVTALAGVTASFAAGTFTAVMGPSGSGKSTLLHCAAGLDRPTSGEVILAGTVLRGLSETKLTLLRRRHVGFVFQSFNLLPYLTAGQNVALPLRLAGRRPRRDEIGAALAAVGLDGRAGHRPAELSGGQQQRVAIARALVTGPQVIFADEPTGMLDSASGHEVLSLLRRPRRPAAGHRGHGHARPGRRGPGRPGAVPGRRPAGRGTGRPGPAHGRRPAGGPDRRRRAAHAGWPVLAG